jgi:hypothetical protein
VFFYQFLDYLFGFSWIDCESATDLS